jgi:hypothetical protein
MEIEAVHPTLPKDYDKDPGKLTNKALIMSTICEKDRGNGNYGKGECIFCGKEVWLKAGLLKQHIDGDFKPPTGRHCAPCFPSTEHSRRHRLIRGELRRRARVEEQKTISGQKRGREDDSADGGSAVYGKITRQKVDEQWTRSLIKNGLPIHVVDDEEFRKAVAMTAMCGGQYVDGSGKTRLPHRTTFTNKLIPAMDKKLEAGVKERIEPLMKKTGATLLSDGWTSTSNRPVVNVLMLLFGVSMLLEAIDTSGEIKNMQYIAELVCKHIAAIGASMIVAVCMDGACKGAL